MANGNLLRALPVINDSPTIENYSKTENCQKLVSNVAKATPFQNNHPDHFNEIGNRVEFGNDLGPAGHAVY